MHMIRIVVVVIVIVTGGQTTLAFDPTYANLPPDVLAQFEGRILPPLEDLANSGLLPATGFAAKGTVDEQGFITHWLSHGDMLIGMLDDDLVGEDDIVPICYGNDLSDDEMAPRMYRYTWSNPEIWTYYWSAYENYDTCETVYTDQVRYFFTQVKTTETFNARLLVGADEGIKVWINGVEVMRHEGGEYLVDQYETSVRLTQGWNMVLVKVYYPLIGPSDHPDYEPKAWSLRFTDANGARPLHLIQAVDGWCDHEQSYQWIHAGGVADLPGAFGSQWASDLRLTNPYPYPLELTVQYFREGTVGPAKIKTTPSVPQAVDADAETVIVLDPFETRYYNRVLVNLLDVTPPQKGMIAIRGYYYWDAQNNGAVELKTYNKAGGGTFGTVIPMTYTYAGSTCCSQMLHGLRNGPDFRTNIGMAPRTHFDDQVGFTVTIWDSVTGTLAEREFVGQGNFQLNDIFDRLGLGDVVTNTAVAYITWSRTARNARIRFFGSVVDNHTSDPVDINPGLYLPLPSQE